jgi:hypothetical protein
MMQTMKRKLFARGGGRALLAAALLLGPVFSSPAFARTEEKERDIYDARLEGYGDEKRQPVEVTLPLSSTGLTWVLLVVFGAVGLIGLFKDAKRTHLD